MGIISAKGRQTGLSNGSFEDFLQTDAPGKFRRRNGQHSQRTGWHQLANLEKWHKRSAVK